MTKSMTKSSSAPKNVENFKIKVMKRRVIEASIIRGAAGKCTWATSLRFIYCGYSRACWHQCPGNFCQRHKFSLHISWLPQLNCLFYSALSIISTLVFQDGRLKWAKNNCLMLFLPCTPMATNPFFLAPTLYPSNHSPNILEYTSPSD